MMRLRCGLLLIGCLAASGMVGAVNCLEYMSADRDFQMALKGYAHKIEATHPGVFQNVLETGALVAALAGGGTMDYDTISVNTRQPPERLDLYLGMWRDCEASSGMCLFSVGVGVRQSIANLHEDTAPAADALLRAAGEAQDRYVAAYTVPEPGWHRDVGSYDFDLVF